MLDSDLAEHANDPAALEEATRSWVAHIRFHRKPGEAPFSTTPILTIPIAILVPNYLLKEAGPIESIS